jgi:hypothetical protein
MISAPLHPSMADRVAADGAPPGPGSPGPVRQWRRWRVPLVLVLVILLGGVVVALLQPSPTTSWYLDPASTGTTGAHAITDILAGRGQAVIRATTPAAAESDVSRAGPGPVTLVITSPGLLTARQLGALARARADVVVIGPDDAALAAFAPGVAMTGAVPPQELRPDCDLPAATTAGSADMGGVLMSTTGFADAVCYPAVSGASLLAVPATGGRVVTLLGSGNALTNGSLARLGNAALALNLLRAPSRIVWLVPGPGVPGGAGGQKSVFSLIPLTAYLVTIQLGFALALTALWRTRRHGPLVAEPLPVVVRASETTEGHARLYQSRRARGRAAAVLREAMLARLLPMLGLAPGARQQEVLSAISARSGSGAARAEAIVFGPAPADDAALVALADDLDALEREVRGQ